MAFNIGKIFRRSTKPSPVGALTPAETKNMIVGANDLTGDNLKAFDNSTITYSSELNSVDYDNLLRDKQENINTLYQLADYYCDADAIVRGIIKGVYVPFSSTQWYLSGDNEKTIAIFEEQYKKMHLDDIIDDVFYQYWKYSNVYCYIWQGNIMTIPPHKCKIGNTVMNDSPIVDYDVQSIENEFRERAYSVLEAKGVKDDVLNEVLKGYPPEVADAIKKGNQYAQLDPQNSYVLQGDKEGWTRYSIPWIAAALPALAKKELIGKYETALLNIGARSFIHATYGDSTKNQDILPGIEDLRAVRQIFSSAMSGNPLAVTNHLAKATVVQADLSDLYQWPMYEQVNTDILAAGGIANIIVNGQSENGSTFASAQISMQAAVNRINAARKKFERFMNKVNLRLVEDLKLIHTNNLKDIPEFHFVPLDVNSQTEMRNVCQSLWQNGLLSTRTFMESNGYNFAKERERREAEKTDGTDKIMVSREQKAAVQSAKSEQPSEQIDTSNGKKRSVGRPKKSTEERHSDPDNAQRSKQAKDTAKGKINSE